MTTLLERYDAFAIDLDGVVWRGGRMIEGSAEALNAIKGSGKRLLLITNNASYSPAAVSARLGREGVDIDPAQVISTAVVARRWIEVNGLRGRPAMLIAPPQVADQLSDLVERVDVDEEGMAKAALVLVARDTTFDFQKLSAASAAVCRGAHLVAVNRDPVLPVEAGLEPGTGAIVAAIEAACGRDAVVLGKPEAPMMSMAAAILGRTGVVMIGDRIASDVVGGRSVGWDTALVLSGATDSTDGDGPQPDHVLGSLLDVTR